MLLVSIIAAITLHIYALTMVVMGSKKSLVETLTGEGRWGMGKVCIMQALVLTISTAALYWGPTRLPMLIWGICAPMVAMAIRMEVESAIDSGDGKKLIRVLTKGVLVAGTIFLVCLTLFFAWICT